MSHFQIQLTTFCVIILASPLMYNYFYMFYQTWTHTTPVEQASSSALVTFQSASMTLCDVTVITIVAIVTEVTKILNVIIILG